MSDKLKYLGYSIVFQEVPNEVSLAINISGCPHKCEGCHSKYLWEYKGSYISDDFEQLLNKYKGLITCICFMGGDQNQEELLELLILSHQNKLKTALYSGCDSFQDMSLRVLCNLDYIKLGHYDEKFGGLDKNTTNQRIYHWENSKWENITYKFQKEDKQ